MIVWQNAVSNFFLAGAGIAAYVTVSRMEHEIRISQSVLVFLLTKVGDLVAIWLALLISSNLVWAQIGILPTPVIILLAGIGIIMLVFFSTVLFRQGFVSIINVF
jgi:hypothetical protein